jgi:hypothetical protein
VIPATALPHDIVKLWLDDVRQPPDPSWTRVKTVAEARSLMESAEVLEASLDHDLGPDEHGAELPAGRTLVYWMAEHDIWPSEAITIHSANVVGVEYMTGMIERYSPLVRVGHGPRFVRPERVS